MVTSEQPRKESPAAATGGRTIAEPPSSLIQGPETTSDHAEPCIDKVATTPHVLVSEVSDYYGMFYVHRDYELNIAEGAANLVAEPATALSCNPRTILCAIPEQDRVLAFELVRGVKPAENGENLEKLTSTILIRVFSKDEQLQIRGKPGGLHRELGGVFYDGQEEYGWESVSVNFPVCIGNMSKDGPRSAYSDDISFRKCSIAGVKRRNYQGASFMSNMR